jgi:hypothetical protein
MALPSAPSNLTGLALPLAPLSCPDGFSSFDSVSVSKDSYQYDCGYEYELGSFQRTKRRRIAPTPQMLASLLEEESPPSSPVAPRRVSMPAPPQRTVDFITELMPSLRLSIHDDCGYDSSTASGNSNNEKENDIKLPAKPMPSKSYRPSKLYSTTLGNSASDNKMAT